MATPAEIYLVRHAIAAQRGEEWPDDDKRPLTARGVARFKESVNGLSRLDVVVDEIFTSPLVRAKQTAELLAAGLPGKPSIKVLDALSPGHAPGSVLAQLAKAARRRRIALVGHEPGLGELAAHLIGAGRALPFKKGGVCRIDVESLTSRRAGALSWFVTPKVLRGLSKK
ncbi:MAG: phosphohistidine phosphatase SixA [Acidobacteria bacterium]|nr:phosphohistidine phosphatase SixA [Acidobacteriota bacterium]